MLRIYHFSQHPCDQSKFQLSPASMALPTCALMLVDFWLTTIVLFNDFSWAPTSFYRSRHGSAMVFSCPSGWGLPIVLTHKNGVTLGIQLTMLVESTCFAVIIKTEGFQQSMLDEMDRWIGLMELMCRPLRTSAA